MPSSCNGTYSITIKAVSAIRHRSVLYAQTKWCQTALHQWFPLVEAPHLCYHAGMLDALHSQDPAIAELIELEARRQRDKVELIASENYTSAAVRDAVGSILTNKYAEGYPGKRYYGGCEIVDQIEVLAIERAKELFGAEHANVQPHAGSSTNMAAYFALLEPGDTVLALSFSHGGHLTHGNPANFSAKLYNFVHYGVASDTEQIDYDALEQQALALKPKLLVAGATAYPREIDFARFRAIADACGALLLVDMAHIAGLVAAGLHQSPVPYADVVTTSTHKTLRGPRGGLILCRDIYAKAIDKAIIPGTQGGPLLHVIAGKAVAFAEATTPEFQAYQKQVVINAQSLAASLRDGGLRLVSGGTDNHMLLIDFTDTHPDLTGKAAEKLLDSVNITVNKNAVPREARSPFITSGIRLGSPAVTTRGLTEEDMQQLGTFILHALEHRESIVALQELGEDVRTFISDFPLP
jgi:glycine hydroxymethyltransferase